MGSLEGEGLDITSACCEWTFRKLYTSLRAAAVTAPQLLLGHCGSLKAARQASLCLYGSEIDRMSCLLCRRGHNALAAWL